MAVMVRYYKNNKKYNSLLKNLNNIYFGNSTAYLLVVFPG